MHRTLVYAAYGWLTLGGAMHLIVDVLAQWLRGKRAPGPATTLFYGMNSAYALGQMAVGGLGLVVARAAMPLLGQWPAIAVTVGAAVAWLAFGFVFIEYWEPKLVAGLFALLAVAAAVTR